MRVINPDPELVSLLERYGNCGGILDYVLLDSELPSQQIHREAAIAGMIAIDRRLEQWAVSHATPKFPPDKFFRLQWDESSMKGETVPFSKFWGTDDMEPKPINGGAWSIPIIDGYKTAFFHPPYGLQETSANQKALFEGINKFVLGPIERCEIVSWSNNWSNYFDAGLEWWGAFYWTIRHTGTGRLAVIGASSTD